MNLIIDRSNRLAHDNCWEWKYVMDIFRQVEKKNLNQYQFILTDNLECLPIVPTKNTVVLIISDEKYIIPKYTHEVKAIFKNYAYPDQESLNIYAIPQGHNKDLIFYPYKNIDERIYDISFQGNFHTYRPVVINNIINELNNRNLKINSLIQPSASSFEYSYNLWNTKISLCLDGQITPENFRFFESSIYGCVTIASENLPNNWIYQSNHYLKVNWQNTKQIVDLISELITNKEKLQQYSLKSYDTWNNLYDSTKIADYIESKIL